MAVEFAARCESVGATRDCCVLPGIAFAGKPYSSNPIHTREVLKLLRNLIVPFPSFGASDERATSRSQVRPHSEAQRSDERALHSFFFRIEALKQAGPP